MKIAEKRVSFDIPRELHRAATLAASRRGVSLAAFLRKITVRELVKLPPAPMPGDYEGWPVHIKAE